MSPIQTFSLPTFLFLSAMLPMLEKTYYCFPSIERGEGALRVGGSYIADKTANRREERSFLLRGKKFSSAASESSLLCVEPFVC